MHLIPVFWNQPVCGGPHLYQRPHMKKNRKDLQNKEKLLCWKQWMSNTNWPSAFQQSGVIPCHIPGPHEMDCIKCDPIITLQESTAYFYRVTSRWFVAF